MRQKIIRRKILILPPSYPLTFSLPDFFWNTAEKGYSTKYFGTVRKNFFDGKSWHNRLKQKIVWYSKKRHTKGFPYEISRHSERKKFRRKILILPPVLIHKLNRYRKHTETQHKKVPRKIFWCCETKKSTKNRDITVLSMKLFDTRIQWHGKGFPYETFPHSGQKIFEGEFWHFPLPLIQYYFSIPEFFWNTAHNCYTTKWFRFVRQKLFDGKSWQNPQKHEIFLWPKIMTH